jgi:predicted metal-binding protein
MAIEIIRICDNCGRQIALSLRPQVKVAEVDVAFVCSDCLLVFARKCLFESANGTNAQARPS